MSNNYWWQSALAESAQRPILKVGTGSVRGVGSSEERQRLGRQLRVPSHPSHYIIDIFDSCVCVCVRVCVCVCLSVCVLLHSAVLFRCGYNSLMTVLDAGKVASLPHVFFMYPSLSTRTGKYSCTLRGGDVSEG